ncbi:hypothetical protein VNO77_21675 [Canavalia gladiata]|uniref:Uncharacterized protein n=1 Tax=Canavalia gladiata TaxID=3824 RepID=A0AAN9QNP1_CANGL
MCWHVFGFLCLYLRGGFWDSVIPQSLNEMAIELCSENCGVSSVSPRISFSHDFSQSDVIPVEQLPFRSNSSGLNSSIDFDFRVSESFELESSSADELFSHGRILPTEIKRKNVPLKQTIQLAPHSTSLPPPYAGRENASTSKNLKKDQVYEKQSSKSFWSFRRSSSCGSGYGRSFCPLPLLSRSNSTGSSTPSVKRNPLSKEAPNIKPNSHKLSSTRITHSFVPNSYQRPPLNKNHGSYGTNSVRVNPVLNVPSANLFGLASIFSNNKDKTKKK